MQNTAVVPVENLKEKPYASVLCYPRANEVELENRLEELKRHGVEVLEFAGKACVFNVPVLGKGFVGIVVIAHMNGHRVALKIRRVDAGRLGLQHEAEMLAKANSVNVGPKLIGASTNFLLTQLIDGDLLPRWLETHQGKEQMHRVIEEILEQCWWLDAAGLDHGELSNASKHIIIDKGQKPFIVDFETASVNRKPANVTAACQYLFTSKGATARRVAETLGEKNINQIIEALRLYKHDRARINFEHLLQTCLAQPAEARLARHNISELSGQVYDPQPPCQ